MGTGTGLAVSMMILVAGCNSTPQTATDRLWYDGYAEAQRLGGTCTDQTCRYRDYLHDVVGVPYESMQLVSSYDLRVPSHALLHLRLQVKLRSGLKTFDPRLDAFNYAEGGWGCPYVWHETRAIFRGDYRPVEPGGIYHRTEAPTSAR